MLDDQHPPTITALPDAASTPSQAKNARLHDVNDVEIFMHLDEGMVGEGSSNGVLTVPGQLDAGSGEEKDGEQGELSPVVTAVPLMEEVEPEQKEEWWELKMSWSGKVFELKVGGNDMVYDFRAKIESLTSVPPVRQKLIGLTKGKLSAELDSTRFGAIGIKREAVRFTMIGTPEAMSFKDPSQVQIPDLLDNFDVTYSSITNGKGHSVAPADDPRNKRKVEEVVKNCPITVMNAPRPGKKLLVLDIDYTILDTKRLIAGSLPADECARPGLHDFLERVYPFYDIAVWSQTHWRYLEAKLVEIGMLGGTANYKVSFVADRTPMFPVFTMRNGQPYKHEVKPLAYFWASFPQWSAKNTIHIDDLARNFALNPGEGLRIRQFNTAGTTRGLQDRELNKLGNYLTNIATNVEDFTNLDHSKWKKGPREPSQAEVDRLTILPR